jgi:opacity protein-like surface antigen
MKPKKVVIGVLSTVLSGAAIAGTMGVAPNSWLRVVTLSAGAAWTTNGDTQTFFLQPETEKTYSADKKTSTLFIGELFYGWQRALNHTLSGQIGFEVAGASNASLSGQIWDDALPEFNNFTYGYKVNHAHVAVKGKLLADMGAIVIPYFSGSVGVGFNHAYSFSNTPIIFEALPDPNFAAKTVTAFSYTAGIGAQRALSQNWQVGIGYEFADWGRSELGFAQGQTLGNGLKLAHIYTNGVLLNISYLA